MSEPSEDRAGYALRRVVDAEKDYEVLRRGEVVGSLRGIMGTRRKPARWRLTLEEGDATAVTREFVSFAAATAWLGLFR